MRSGECASAISHKISSLVRASHSVRDRFEIGFEHVGHGPSDFVKTEPDRVRPWVVDTLLADPAKVREEPGWSE